MQHGVVLKYLPAYSPDFNPIEITFHLLKAWMKRNRTLAPAWGEEGYIERFEEFLILAVEGFQRGVNFKDIFRRCYVRVQEEEREGGVALNPHPHLGWE